MIEFNLELDASGLNCPLPLLRLKKALIGMSSGDVVKVIATDPAAHLDFGVYADQTGHQIIQLIKESDRQIFYFKKNSVDWNKVPPEIDSPRTVAWSSC